MKNRDYAQLNANAQCGIENIQTTDIGLLLTGERGGGNAPMATTGALKAFVDFVNEQWKGPT